MMAHIDIRKVLVVDADEHDRTALRGHLEHHGYIVECAENAVDAIRVGLVLEPRLVLSDLHLGEDSQAEQVFHALRRRLPDVHTALVCAAPDDETLARYRNIGIDAVFEKPLRREHLDEYLARLFATPPKDQQENT